MFVTVVRNKIGDVVELPGGIFIRPFNFVELKSLDQEMKRSLALLEKAGTVDVAQVAHTDQADGMIENMMPSDTTGAAAAMFQTDEDRKSLLERVKEMSDVLTDYSKPHAMTTKEVDDRRADIDERTERAKASGDGAPTMRVIAVDQKMLDAERDAVKRPNPKPLNAQEAEDELDQNVIDRVDASLEVVAAVADAAKPVVMKQKKKVEHAPT